MLRRGAVGVIVVLAIAALPTASAAEDHPTPGVACQAGSTLPRIVPEPEATNDYVGFEEARECLRLIEEAAPQRVEWKTIGQSAGWEVLGGAFRTHDVWLVEITNEDSPVPFENRIKHVFQLSVHGNEKGGREGGLRAIEDLARCLDTPGAITSEYPELCDYLDYMVAVFTFPNPDGWVHEEAEVFGANPGTGFVRENGNGYDLNRQWPNKGWTRESYQTLSQPEIQASLDHLTNYTNIATATDIHGMLVPTDADIQGEVAGFGPDHASYEPGGSLLEGLLDAGQATPLKMFETTRLAELLKERVNTDPSLAAWNSAPATGVWGGQVMEWGTSWDTIGYVDSGFTGDFFFQQHGLDAVAMDFEMAYNHVVCDNVYAGCGQTMNIFHTRLVRQIVAVFMESSTVDVQLSYESHGTRTAWLQNPGVVSSTQENGTTVPLTGWAQENSADDAYDFAHVPYERYSGEFVEEIQRVLREGDRPGVLELVQPRDLTLDGLGAYDNLVIAGTAYRTVARDAAATDAVSQWVSRGGRLVLTDSALMMLDDWYLGATPAGGVTLRTGYAGCVDFIDRDHDLASGLRGLSRQTYEGVPLGYEPGAAPIFTISWSALEATGASVVGVENCGNGGAPGSGEPVYGTIPTGAGSIHFLGALLPDPVQEFYHPYGVDAYATTYTGNQLLRNMLGWSTVFAEPPLVVEDLGRDTQPPADEPAAAAQAADSPGFAAVGTLAGLAMAWVARRRKDQDN